MKTHRFFTNSGCDKSENYTTFPTEKTPTHAYFSETRINFLQNYRIHIVDTMWELGAEPIEEPKKLRHL